MVTNPAELKQLHQCDGGCAPATRCRSRINRFCHTLGDEKNQLRFRQAPEKYCRTFELTMEEMEAITDLDVPRLISLGANLSCLEHLTATFNLNVAELGAQQSNTDVSEFISILKVRNED